MAHYSSASVQVTNGFPYAADITINHAYDTSPSESHTWPNVMPGTTTDPDMRVMFNLGMFSPGHDTWQAEVTLLAGPNKGHYLSGVAKCTLHKGDVGQILTFKVDDISGFAAHASINNDVQGWTTLP